MGKRNLLVDLVARLSQRMYMSPSRPHPSHDLYRKACCLAQLAQAFERLRARKAQLVDQSIVFLREWNESSL